MKKALKTIVEVFAWILLILSLLITVMVFSSDKNNGVSDLMGYIPLTVESDSMKPTFSKKDLIICKEIDDVMKIESGDVITYWTIIEGERVKNTHRITKINEFENTRSFITRGDANNIDDEYTVYAGDLIGEWTGVKLSGLGAAVNFLKTKKGFFICIIIPLALLFLFELYKLIITIIEVKRPALSENEQEEIKKRAIEEYLAQQQNVKQDDDNAVIQKSSDDIKNTGEKQAEIKEKNTEEIQTR